MLIDKHGAPLVYAGEQKASQTALVDIGGFGGSPVRFKHGQKLADAEKEILCSDTLFACLQQITNAVGSIEWLVQDGAGETSADHPVAQLLNRPNPTVGAALFHQQWALEYALLRNAFVYQIPVRDQSVPMELHTMQSKHIETIPDKVTGCVARYTYGSGSSKQTFEVDEDGFSEVLHIRGPSISDPLHGDTPLDAVYPSLAQAHKAQEWNATMFDTNFGPQNGFAFDQQQVTPEQAVGLKGVMRSYMGLSGARKGPLLLSASLKHFKLGESHKDIQYLEALRWSQEQTAMVMGVPIQLINSAVGTTFNNREEAKLAFWEQTILPVYATAFANAATPWLLRSEPGLRVTYDETKISALKYRTFRQAETLEKTSFLTINEKRAEMGRGKVPGGDQILVNMNSAPLDEDFGPVDTPQIDGDEQ